MKPKPAATAAYAIRGRAPSFLRLGEQLARDEGWQPGAKLWFQTPHGLASRLFEMAMKDAAAVDEVFRLAVAVAVCAQQPGRDLRAELRALVAPSSLSAVERQQRAQAAKRPRGAGKHVSPDRVAAFRQTYMKRQGTERGWLIACAQQFGLKSTRTISRRWKEYLAGRSDN